METWSAHHLFKRAEDSLGRNTAEEIARHALSLREKGLPIIFTLRHLAKITGTDYRVLHASVLRKRERSNYRMFAIRKRSGGRRFIHAPCPSLSIVQEFINSEILQRVSPNPAAFAFHRDGGIRRCAEMHCGSRWILHFDLQDFFHHITEMEVFEVFKGLGYRPLLAFEMARLCTTTHMPRRLDRLCDWRRRSDRHGDVPYKATGRYGVLPQGAPTSPMLSNLAARNLDRDLASYAGGNGFVYTRYADDLVFSTVHLPGRKSIGRIRSEIVEKIYSNGFVENEKKFRVAGPGARKVVLGLLVDGDRPRLSRDMRKRVDRYLHAMEKYGVDNVAEHEGFDTAYGFYNHVSGLVAHVKDVEPARGERFFERLRNVPCPAGICA